MLGKQRVNIIVYFTFNFTVFCVLHGLPNAAGCKMLKKHANKAMFASDPSLLPKAAANMFKVCGL